MSTRSHVIGSCRTHFIFIHHHPHTLLTPTRDDLPLSSFLQTALVPLVSLSALLPWLLFRGTQWQCGCVMLFLPVQFVAHTPCEWAGNTLWELPSHTSLHANRELGLTRERSQRITSSAESCPAASSAVFSHPLTIVERERPPQWSVQVPQLRHSQVSDVKDVLRSVTSYLTKGDVQHWDLLRPREPDTIQLTRGAGM